MNVDADGVDLDVISEMTANFTGADLKALLYNAQLLAVHRRLDALNPPIRQSQEAISPQLCQKQEAINPQLRQSQKAFSPQLDQSVETISLQLSSPVKIVNSNLSEMVECDGENDDDELANGPSDHDEALNTNDDVTYDDDVTCDGAGDVSCSRNDISTRLNSSKERRRKQPHHHGEMLTSTKLVGDQLDVGLDCSNSSQILIFGKKRLLIHNSSFIASDYG